MSGNLPPGCAEKLCILIPFDRELYLRHPEVVATFVADQIREIIDGKAIRNIIGTLTESGGQVVLKITMEGKIRNE